MSYSPAAERRQFPPVIDSNFSDAYHRWFEVISADTPALQEKAYRLRYQVYCCEHQYEVPDEHPLRLETDEFDCRSIHSLILDRATGAAVGTVRLILSNGDTPQSGLPIQQLCGNGLSVNLRPSGAAEISRFAISKNMKRMADEDCPKNLKCSLVLGLLRAVVQMSFEYGITDWLAVMEPGLLRLLCRFGICFSPVGPMIEYHGMRLPCHANVAKLLDTARRERYDLWEFVTTPENRLNHARLAVG